MTDVTRLLDRCGAGDAAASEELLPLVYEELRRLAHRRMAAESAGHTLQATGLVHEAYLRLVRRPNGEAGGDDGDGGEDGGTNDGGTNDGGTNDGGGWDSRGHFFAAAAEAMRRILIESARRRGRLKHGGGRRRVPLGDGPGEAAPLANPPGFADDGGAGELLALDAALVRFERRRPRAAAVVKLRYFAGLSFEEAAAAVGVSRATAVRDWTLGRAWLHRAIAGERTGDSSAVRPV